eukprot:9056515-Karenia_brevis.AAC.1
MAHPHGLNPVQLPGQALPGQVPIDGAVAAEMLEDPGRDEPMENADWAQQQRQLEQQQQQLQAALQQVQAAQLMQEQQRQQQ